MTTKKKLTASILIISLFMCLPEPEAKAAGDADDSIFAATSFDFPINDSRQADCTGLYSIFSPCYTLQINTISNYGNGSLEMYDTDPMDHALFNDEDQILPWEDELEQPPVGFLIPILHF